MMEYLSYDNVPGIEESETIAATFADRLNRIYPLWVGAGLTMDKDAAMWIVINGTETIQARINDSLRAAGREELKEGELKKIVDTGNTRELDFGMARQGLYVSSYKPVFDYDWLIFENDKVSLPDNLKDLIIAKLKVPATPENKEMMEVATEFLQAWLKMRDLLRARGKKTESIERQVLTGTVGKPMINPLLFEF